MKASEIEAGMEVAYTDRLGEWAARYALRALIEATGEGPR